MAQLSTDGMQAAMQAPAQTPPSFTSQPHAPLARNVPEAPQAAELQLAESQFFGQEQPLVGQAVNKFTFAIHSSAINLAAQEQHALQGCLEAQPAHTTTQFLPYRLPGVDPISRTW